jgi:cell division protein FtsB
MNPVAKRLIYVAALVSMAVYGYISLTGPQGLPALRAKWNEIHQLEEQNKNLEHDNQVRKEHLERLQNNPAEQDLEIRKRLKVHKPGETSFILPEAPKPAK